AQDVLTRLVRKLRNFRYDPQRGTFRSWLRTLTEHAWSDYVASRQAAVVGTGDSTVLGQLAAVEARADLLEHLAQAFDLELLEEAQARVAPRGSPPRWR